MGDTRIFNSIPILLRFTCRSGKNFFWNKLISATSPPSPPPPPPSPKNFRSVYHFRGQKKFSGTIHCQYCPIFTPILPYYLTIHDLAHHIWNIKSYFSGLLSLIQPRSEIKQVVSKRVQVSNDHVSNRYRYRCLWYRWYRIPSTRYRPSLVFATKTMAVRIFRSGKISNFGGIFFPIVHLFRLGSIGF